MNKNKSKHGGIIIFAAIKLRRKIIKIRAKKRKLLPEGGQGGGRGAGVKSQRHKPRAGFIAIAIFLLWC